MVIYYKMLYNGTTIYINLWIDNSMNLSFLQLPVLGFLGADFDTQQRAVRPLLPGRLAAQVKGYR